MQKTSEAFAWQKASPSDIRFRLASSMLSLNKKKEAGDFCERWYGEDENDPAAAAALIYAWIADRRYKDAQKLWISGWIKKAVIQRKMQRFLERQLFCRIFFWGRGKIRFWKYKCHFRRVVTSMKKIALNPVKSAKILCKTP